MSAASSDDERFESIYNATREDLARYLLRRCDSTADAADIAAETYLVVWRRRAEAPFHDEIRPWLFGVARNVLANHRRSGEARTRLAQRLQQHLDATLAASPTTDPDSGSAAEVRGALLRLRPLDRELLTLVIWEGLSPREAAIVVGLSDGAARVRLHRARERMRSELLGAIPTSPSGAATTAEVGCTDH